MKRSAFLKSLGIGLGVTVVTPQLLIAKEPIKEEEKVNLAIDLMSIQNITVGGKRLTPWDIMEIWHETGVLFYRSHTPVGIPCNTPVVFKGKVKTVDISKPKG